MNNSTKLGHAIVTGGASGLGRAFCLHLARHGWHVAVADIDLKGAAETLLKLKKLGGQGQVELLDVRETGHWEQLIAKLRDEWPRLDLLVNNAGVCGAGNVGTFSMENAQRIIDVNLLGVMRGCQAVVPWMLQTGVGGIVNIASIAASLSAPTMSSYSASKAGLVAYSESLYGELLSYGIHVTIVLPGFFRSNLLDSGQYTDERLKDIAAGYSRHSSFDTTDVVEATMRAFEKRQLYVVLGKKARWAWRLKRFAPGPFQKYIVRQFANELKKSPRRN